MSQASSPLDQRSTEADDFVGPDRHIVHHTSVRKRRGVLDNNMQLNLTAMIDVIFLLLIYFVISANFAVGEGVIVAKLPTGSGPTKADPFAAPKQNLKIYLRSAGGLATDCRIEVDGAGSETLTFVTLQNLLRRLQKGADNPNPEALFKFDDPVLITPDNEVRWQHVVNAFNAALAARYHDVRFAESSR